MHRPVRTIGAVTLLVLALRAAAQPAQEAPAGALALALDRLQVVGHVLYVAAHPDDENTAFLAAMAQGRLVGAAYLSCTRGDGGQNLIGTEKGELMGLLRTEELLSARRIDGARQFFTRALDFGYSKTPDETLRLWGHDEVLADVVRVVRTFRPDVIVTRFPTTGEGGHGHHTASAILAEEAFTAAADPKRFPEQLREGLAPWQAKRLLWNVFRFGGNAPRNEKAGDVSIDLGAYNPLLGVSYTELAARSRSMHKSQGFGTPERRGSFVNDFRPILGAPPAGDLFDGVDLTWNRVPGGAAVIPLLARARKEFDPERPEKAVPLLLEADRAMAKLAGPDVAEKRAELKDAVRAALGIWLDAVSAEETATPGGAAAVELVALNRSSLPVTLAAVEATGLAPQELGEALSPNKPLTRKVSLPIPKDAAPTVPYWLRRPPLAGRYVVEDARLVGRPESPPALEATFTLLVSGERLRYTVPVVFRKGDPVQGEIVRPFVIAPPVALDFAEKVLVFPAGTSRKVAVTARAFAPVSGTERLTAPSGWRAEPAGAPLSLAGAGEEARSTFTVVPDGGAEVGSLAAEAVLPGETVSRSLVRVDYPHIMRQTLFPPAAVKGVNLSVAAAGSAIGYVMGSGDDVPEVLRQLGYQVTLLSDDDLSSADLSRFAAIVVGIRAYNTRPRLKQDGKRLFAYVEGGGALLVQYQTRDDMVTTELGPFPFKVSRDRVTVEEAPVAFLDPKHPLLHEPNEIGEADFRGWVQERGLYFAGDWDPRYETVLESHDPGEPGRKGGLLFARHGKGTYVYTGYAFFRQLPAGVPGAIRLFVNLLSPHPAKG